MSTRVTPEEYGTLHVAQDKYCSGILCEYEGGDHQRRYSTDRAPFHWGSVLMATPDNRSIMVCRAAQDDIVRRRLASL